MRFVVPIPIWLYALYLGALAVFVGAIATVAVMAATVVGVVAYVYALVKWPAETIAGTILFLLIALAIRFPLFGLVLLVLFVCSAIWGRSSDNTQSELSEESARGKAAEEERQAKAAEEATVAIAAQRDARRRELAEQGFEGYEQFKK